MPTKKEVKLIDAIDAIDAIEAVLRIYGNLSVLPSRGVEIIEMLNKILEEKAD